MNTSTRNRDRSGRFESMCYIVTYVIIGVVSPAYGLWTLTNYPVI